MAGSNWDARRPTARETVVALKKEARTQIAGRRKTVDRKVALERIRNSFFMQTGLSLSQLIIEDRDGDDDKDERKHV